MDVSGCHPVRPVQTRVLNMNTRTTAVTASLMLTLTGLPLGAAQHWELAGGVFSIDREGYDTTALVGGGTYFLDPLTLASPEPLAEATFIERPRSFHADVRYTTYDFSDEYFAWTDMDGFDLNVGYTHRRSTSPHVFRVRYEYATTWGGTGSSDPYGVDLTEESHAIGLDYSYYILPRLAVGIETQFTGGESEAKYGTEINVRDRDVLEGTFGGRWLHPLGGDRWLRVDASFTYLEYHIDELNWSRTDEDSRISAGITYYFSRRTGLSVDASREREMESNTFLASVDHFFNEQWAINLGGGIVTHRHGDDDTVMGGTLRVRF